MATNENRMDIYLIPDNLYRAALYRELINQTPYISKEHWYEHTIQPGEVLMPELIAYRVYGDERLKWVVLITAGLSDYRQAMEAGNTLTLPSQEWLLDRIKYYTTLYQIDVEPKSLQVIAEPMNVGSGAPEIPGTDIFQTQLTDALQALAGGIPLISESDEISDESLNRQRHDIQQKMDAVAGILDQFRK